MPQDKPVEGTDAAEAPDQPQDQSSTPAAAPAPKAAPRAKAAPKAKPATEAAEATPAAAPKPATKAAPRRPAAKATPAAESTPAAEPVAAPAAEAPAQPVAATAPVEPAPPVDPAPPVEPAPPVATVPVGYGAADGYGATASVSTVAVDEDEVDLVRATLVGPSLLARVGAEAFGTFVVVLAVLGAALYAGVSSQTLATPLAYGFGVIAAFVAVAHVSGGHFNPAVTVGAAIAGRTPWGHVLPYWVAQLVGGALASAVMFVVYASFPLLDGQERSFFSTVANGFDTHSPLAQSTGSTDGGFGLVPALLIEAVLVAIIVGVYLGATDRRGSRQQAGVAVGLTVAFATLIAVPVTNAALNPARATAAAIFSESWAWSQLWLFWVAPLIGAVVAGVLYRAFASAPEEDDLVDEEIEIEEIEVRAAR